MFADKIVTLWQSSVRMLIDYLILSDPSYEEKFIM